MEIRKIQKTGGSTYTVSLPKEWVTKRVKKGDAISIQRFGENLILSTAVGTKIKSRKANIIFHKSIETLLRKVISYYLLGYEDFIIHNCSHEKFAIKKILKEKIIGMEVVDEDINSLKLKVFLKYEDFSFNKTLKRMHFIITNEMIDLKEAILSNNKELLMEITERDNELDRFYLLGIKQLRSTLNNPHIEDEYIDPLSYMLILKNLERIGDHIYNIAKKYERLALKDDIKDKIILMLSTAANIFNDTIKSLLKRDMAAADKCMILSPIYVTRKDIRTSIRSMKYSIELLSIVDSLKRIAEYSSDIAEAVINLSIEKR